MPLDDDARYTVVAIDIVLGGGDSNTMLKTGELLIGVTDGKLLANEVVSDLWRNGIVSFGVRGADPTGRLSSVVRSDR